LNSWYPYTALDNGHIIQEKNHSPEGSIKAAYAMNDPNKMLKRYVINSILTYK
jgi:hypothetical protein